MTKVKLCGLSRESDIAAVNKLKPDLVGFVFAKKSKRYVSPEQAEHLKSLLAPGILAAGVFVNEPVEAVAELLDRGVIDVAQLHGSEDDDYIARLRSLTGKPIFRAFKVKSEADPPSKAAPPTSCCSTPARARARHSTGASSGACSGPISSPAGSTPTTSRTPSPRCTPTAWM